MLNIDLNHCNICPRQCGANRSRRGGFCHAGAEVEAASVTQHYGEEPVLVGRKGVCNVFFTHCNLQCCFCQNKDISQSVVDPRLVAYHTLDDLVNRIASLLPQTENMLGLVSPSHYAHRIPALITALHQRGLYPTVVYNTNGYDSPEVLRQLAPYIDIYLPDFKYMDSLLAQRYSQAADYPQRAQAALREMYAQKGSALPTDDKGLAFRGIIVRHLVLPGQVQNAIDCLRWIADNLSTRLHLSLMAQYCPPQDDTSLPDELQRRLRSDEYQAVVDAFYELGFSRGWIQNLDAADNYLPNFQQRDPFK